MALQARKVPRTFEKRASEENLMGSSAVLYNNYYDSFNCMFAKSNDCVWFLRGW